MNIKEFRISTGMNSKDFADAVEVSRSEYYKIEEGHRNPTFNFIRKVKERYPEIDIDEVFFTATQAEETR